MRIVLALLVLLASFSVSASDFDGAKELPQPGLPTAHFNLGSSYYTGKGTPQNYKEALKWFKTSAEQGNAGAQYDLGVIHYEGEGTPQDYKKAHMWWNIAAANGNEEAKSNRDKVAEMMTPADISEAQQMASDWMKPHHLSVIAKHRKKPLNIRLKPIVFQRVPRPCRSTC